MQTCSWVLAVCLAVAVTARPEGMPPTVEAARVVEGAAPNAIKEHAAIEQPGAEVPAFKPLPVDAAKDEIAKPLDETKGETFKPLPVGEVAKPLEEAKKDAVKEEPAKGTQQGEEEAIKLPVPIEPDFGSPDDPKVFPEGQLRTPNADPDSSRVAGEKPEGPFIPVAAAAPAAPAAPAPAKEAEKKASRVARAYLPAEARGADTDGLELNLHPDTVLVPYYGGAKGQYLIVAKPVRVGDINKTMKKPDRPGRPGHKEEEEEEENVGEETNEPATKPPASDNDTVTIGHPPSSASMAEARPVGIAIAGEGGVASARPQGTAIVGPGGLAVARPVGTAIAGIQGAEYLITGVAQPQFGPSSFVYPLGPAVPSPLGVPMPYAPTHYAPSQYSPGHYPANHYSASPALQPAQPQWILYPPPGYQYI